LVCCLFGDVHRHRQPVSDHSIRATVCRPPSREFQQ
jgi:hypothetical protein